MIGLTGRARRIASKIKQRALLLATGAPDDYLKSCSGVIHVGASTGQERHDYAERGLRVVWIEPLPQQFKTLSQNIRDLPNQIAINALITDQDGQTHALYVASNNGESSSILEPQLHTDMFPEVTFLHGEIAIKSSTLPTALTAAHLDLADYDALVLDTQGSELLILRGAERILESFRFIKAEAADFEAYKGCSKAEEICSYLKTHGFRLRRKDVTGRRARGGLYFELLFSQKRRWR